ncbi:ABC transporter permease [Bradyrhizobium sp. AC87j1]|nr:ABC transporter permease [Bradyrhizobium sp. AC87j1]
MTGLVAVALAAPLLYPADPRDMIGPSMVAFGTDRSFPLGTDGLGRDVAAGIAYGARTSLVLGALSAGCATVIGMSLGLIAGYARGWVDTVLMGFCELFQTIPHFLLALFVVAILGASISHIILAIALTSWPGVARLVRSQTLMLRELDFVRAAPAMNVGDVRIILTHLMPNVLPAVIANGSILAAVAILGESGLSFLGLGDPDLVSWGSMIGDGRDIIRTAPSLTLLPGSAILITVLSLNLLGDGLNKALDPRRRR